MSKSAPKVSVVTPVYNTGKYLGACIESVLEQSCADFEYIIADNASTDDSLEIAERYAEEDLRIKVSKFNEHLPQISNYNRALRLVNSETDYVKIIQADDLLMPSCLERMTSVADQDPNIAFVSAYTILQDRVFLDGLDFSESIVVGIEICRRYFLDGKYFFGNPSTSLLRTRDVLEQPGFYSETSPFADTDAAIRLLIGRRFAHVHQVLSVVRVEEDSISGKRNNMNIDALTRRTMLERYGSSVLQSEEYERQMTKLRRRHYRILGEGLLTFRGSDFWDFHRKALNDVGLTIDTVPLVCGTLVAIFRCLGNLEHLARRLLDKVWRR